MSNRLFQGKAIANFSVHYVLYIEVRQTFLICEASTSAVRWLLQMFSFCKQNACMGLQMFYVIKQIAVLLSIKCTSFLTEYMYKKCINYVLFFCMTTLNDTFSKMYVMVE